MSRRPGRALDDEAWHALSEQLCARQQLFGRLSLEGLGLATAFHLDEESTGALKVRPLRRPRRRRDQRS